jgi:hypothetical protein
VSSIPLLLQLFEADQNAVNFARESKFGYLDLKYAVQGDKRAGPMTFEIDTKHEGYVFVCQPPGSWGRLPDGCGRLNEDSQVSGNPSISQHTWSSKGDATTSCESSNRTPPPPVVGS